jgi:hypothetical protein
MNYEYSGSSFLARPPMPDQRPHTVHSSTTPFNSCHVKEEEEVHMQGLDFGSAIPRRASLSRDDTAADMSMPFSFKENNHQTCVTHTFRPKNPDCNFGRAKGQGGDNLFALSDTHRPAR